MRSGEVTITIGGKVTATVGEAQHVLTAGSMMYGPAGVPHGLEFNEETEFLTMISPGANFEAFEAELKELIPQGMSFEQEKAIAEKYGITLLKKSSYDSG